MAGTAGNCWRQCQERYRSSTGGDAVTKVTRMRPRRHDAICESLRLALDLPLELRQETRDDLAEALGRYGPPEQWFFMKINPDQAKLVLKAITNGPRPFSTMRVWFAAVNYIRHDTGEIMASRGRLADDAGIDPDEVSRGLARLHEINALLKLRRGRYAINPHVGWSGGMETREAAAKNAPPLRLVEPVS